MTESKKLQTEMEELLYHKVEGRARSIAGPEGYFLNLNKAMGLVALDLLAENQELSGLAHEQREVIKQLVAALGQAREGLMSAPRSWGLTISHVPKADKALAAAAPFLED